MDYKAIEELLHKYDVFACCRRLDRKRSLSGGDDHGRYVDADSDHKKIRYIEEEKGKSLRPCYKPCS